MREAQGVSQSQDLCTNQKKENRVYRVATETVGAPCVLEPLPEQTGDRVQVFPVASKSPIEVALSGGAFAGFCDILRIWWPVNSFRPSC